MPASLKHLTNKRISYYSLLARWKDGLYYTAALLKCDKNKRKCLVCFEDGSEIWANNRDLHLQLSLDQMNEDEDIVCCICDEGNSEQPNYIILCDVCQQGYHQKCHNPPVDSSTIDASDDNSDHKDWICATCSYILRQKDRVKLGAAAAVQQQQQQLKQPSSSSSTPTTSSQQKTVASQPPQQTRSRHIATTDPKPTTTTTKETNQKSTPAATVTPVMPVTTTTTTSPTKAPVAPATISPVAPKPAAKVKQTPTVQERNQKSTIGPIKSTTSTNLQQQQQKQPPYYPLSSQVRAGSTPSTAALASMTASSALVVGSSAGRTKQDLVNQSNRSSQRQRQIIVDLSEAPVAPSKHAVRKSGVNFSPVRQSALPIAERSPIPSSFAQRQPTTPATISSTPPAAVTLSTPPAPKQPTSTTTSAVVAPKTPNLIASTASVSLTPVQASVISRPAPIRPQSIINSPPVRINPTNNQTVDGNGNKHVGASSPGGVVVIRTHQSNSGAKGDVQTSQSVSMSVGAPSGTSTVTTNIILPAPVHVGHQSNNDSNTNDPPLRNGASAGATERQPTTGGAPVATKPTVIVSANPSKLLGTNKESS